MDNMSSSSFYISTLNARGRFLYKGESIEDILIQALLDNIEYKEVFRDLFQILMHLSTSKDPYQGFGIGRRSIRFYDKTGSRFREGTVLERILIKLGNSSKRFIELFEPLIGGWYFEEKEIIEGEQVVKEKVLKYKRSDLEVSEQDARINLITTLSLHSFGILTLLGSVNTNVSIERIVGEEFDNLIDYKDPVNHSASLIPSNLDLNIKAVLLITMDTYKNPYGDDIAYTVRDLMKRNSKNPSVIYKFIKQLLNFDYIQPFGSIPYLHTGNNQQINTSFTLFFSNFLKTFGEIDGELVASVLQPSIGRWFYDKGTSYFILDLISPENLIDFSKFEEILLNNWETLEPLFNKPIKVQPYVFNLEKVIGNSNQYSELPSLLSEVSPIVEKIVVYKIEDQYRLSIKDYKGIVHIILIKLTSEGLEVYKESETEIPDLLFKDKTVMEVDGKIQGWLKPSGNFYQAKIGEYSLEIPFSQDKLKLNVFGEDGKKLNVNYKKADTMKSTSFGKK